ncbi:MAG TPA: helix-turn-helix transcriptional regulator [Solirubrobacterales bacterium]|nr:helix-turn-helix transcriptional regulator [Solirubrobacterales bacterium]
MPRNEKPRVALGRAIRSLRLERGLTQEALAHGAGITVGHLSKIERGQSNPTWETVVAVAGALKVSVSELSAMAESSQAL